MSSLFVERQWCRLLLLVLLGTSCAMALELKDVQITKDGRRYQSQLNFDVSGSVEQVIEILTDYEHPERLTPSVTKREVVGRHGAITRVRTEIHGCVVFFCKDLILTQDVTLADGSIRAEVVADESDFRSGYIHWLITGNDQGGSDIRYQSVIEPDFFVPPLLGRYFMRKWLRKQIFGIAERLRSELAQDPATTAGPRAEA